MGFFTTFALLQIIIVIYFMNFLNCEEYYYELSTIMVNPEYDSKDTTLLKLFQRSKIDVAEYLLDFNEEPNLPTVRKNLENLHQIMENFGNDKCLIVLNNFLEVDIQINNYPIPIILRQFGLVIVHSDLRPDIGIKYLSEENIIIWTSKEYLSKINGNYTENSTSEITLNCHISEHFTPFSYTSSKHGYCVGLNPIKFSSASKPWSCEVQIDLFMPKKIFHLRKHTQIFRCWDCVDIHSLSSNMPKINIVVDETSILKEYEPIAVVNWMSREKYGNVGFLDDTSDFDPVTDHMLFGYVNCVKSGIIEAFTCRATYFEIFFSCKNCVNDFLVKQISFQRLNIDFIKFHDNHYKNLQVTGIFDNWEFSKLSLDVQICYFIQSEQNSIKFPLKNFHKIKTRYSDKIQLLAFAYASIFKDILGNVSWSTSRTFLFERYFKPSIFQKLLGEQVKIEFKFGQLHIVSCGSRGMEPISFLQILTVFEPKIWILLLIFVGLILFCCKHLTGRSFSSSLLGLLKVLLEQGNPFPENNESVNNLKILICGILLSGLVVSNAFKSENVYNIVSPRHLLSYQTLDELVEENFKIFSRIVQYEYNVMLINWEFGFTQLHKHHFLYSQNGYSGFGVSEALSFFGKSLNPLEKKVYENSEFHPETERIYTEPIKLLEPLAIALSKPDINVADSAVRLRFWDNQNALIVKDMHVCNKTAWILPNYLAQEISRGLIKAGKHSDVGTYSYSSPFLYLQLSGLFPLSLISWYSKISASGIVEWWPNLINRTDLIRKKDKIPPAQPNMRGHTQVIFIILCAGLIIALSSLIVELGGIILKFIKALSPFRRIEYLMFKKKLKVKQIVLLDKTLETSASRATLNSPTLH